MIIKISSIFKSVGTIASGTIVSQIVVFLLSPVLSRLYIPDDFGVYTTVLAIVSLISAISNAKLDL